MRSYEEIQGLKTYRVKRLISIVEAKKFEDNYLPSTLFEAPHWFERASVTCSSSIMQATLSKQSIRKLTPAVRPKSGAL